MDPEASLSVPETRAEHSPKEETGQQSKTLMNQSSGERISILSIKLMLYYPMVK